MPQNAKEMDALRKSAGRINRSEYLKLAGTPISKDTPAPTKETSAQKQNRKRISAARDTAQKLGRVNVAEYKALTAKKPRKRIPTK